MNDYEIPKFNIRTRIPIVLPTENSQEDPHNLWWKIAVPIGILVVIQSLTKTSHQYVLAPITVISIALVLGRLKLIIGDKAQYVLDYGSLSFTPLAYASMKGQTKIMEYLLKTPPIDVDDPVDSNIERAFAFQMASAFGHLDALEYFFVSTSPADYNRIVHSDGEKPLTIAIWASKYDVVEFLLVTVADQLAEMVTKVLEIRPDPAQLPPKMRDLKSFTLLIGYERILMQQGFTFTSLVNCRHLSRLSESSKNPHESGRFARVPVEIFVEIARYLLGLDARRATAMVKAAFCSCRVRTRDLDVHSSCLKCLTISADEMRQSDTFGKTKFLIRTLGTWKNEGKTLKDYH